MFGQAVEVYRATRKKNDLLFNYYVMRPIAALVVVVVGRTPFTPNQLTLWNLFLFVVSAALLIVLPDYRGGLIAIGVLEISYCFDCADGMLARHKKIASKEGHLLDFFTDEAKAILLAAVLSIRLYQQGGFGVDLTWWEPTRSWWLFAGLGATIVVASALSLTNFVRRPEISGQATTVEAHYETVDTTKPKSLVGQIAALVMSLLRFLNHYPSHIWIFALFGRFDVFFWMYLSLNLLYLAKGWLGIILRFGRFLKPEAPANESSK